MFPWFVLSSISSRIRRRCHAHKDRAGEIVYAVKGAVARKMLRVNAVSAFDCANKYEFVSIPSGNGVPRDSGMNNCGDSRG